jgi:hypothetical protein
MLNGNANEREFVEEAEVLSFFGQVNVVCVWRVQIRELLVLVGHGKYEVFEIVKCNCCGELFREAIDKVQAYDSACGIRLNLP